ncbi:MAG: hypothetical protein ACLTTO_15680 [Lachnospiraceae bacterium]
MRQKGCRKKKKNRGMKNGEKMVLALQYLKLWKKRKTDAAGFFGTPEEIWQADEREIGEVFGKMKNIRKPFFVKKLPGMRKRHGNEMQKKGIRFISCEDTSYPQKLKKFMIIRSDFL